MDSPPLTPESPWYELISQSSHELATPLSVIRGYLDMLAKQRFGPLNDKQQWILQEIHKSVTRLLALLEDQRQIVSIERGEKRFISSSLDLRRILSDAIKAVPEDENDSKEIVLVDVSGPIGTVGDAPSLKAAFVSLLWALRRELVSTNRLFVQHREGEFWGRPAHWIAIAGAEHIDQATGATAETLAFFDEKRSGANLSLSLARRIIDHHGGALRSPSQDTKAAAVIVLPRS